MRKQDDWRGRFWAKVDKRGPDDCWNWSGAISENGYGSFKLHGRSVTSSRLAFEVDRGAPPSNCMVLHTCDNRPCCNPNHLYLGDVKQNSRDMMERGRGRQGNQIGSANPRAKLTESDIPSHKGLDCRRLDEHQDCRSIRRDSPDDQQDSARAFLAPRAGKRRPKCGEGELRRF